jgi:hypothetical protein
MFIYAESRVDETAGKHGQGLPSTAYIFAEIIATKYPTEVRRTIGEGGIWLKPRGSLLVLDQVERCEHREMFRDPIETFQRAKHEFRLYSEKRPKTFHRMN